MKPLSRSVRPLPRRRRASRAGARRRRPSIGIRCAPESSTSRMNTQHWRSPLAMHVIGASPDGADPRDTKTPQGIIAVVPIPHHRCRRMRTNARSISREIPDPGNLGASCARWHGSADSGACSDRAVSIRGIPKVVRASAGAIFHTCRSRSTCRSTSLAATVSRALHAQTCRATPIRTPGFRAFDCYVFGNDARGIRAKRSARSNARTFAIAGARRDRIAQRRVGCRPVRVRNTARQARSTGRNASRQ